MDADRLETVRRIVENLRTAFDGALKPEAPPKPPELLYHYTTMAGFKSILESESLWVTDNRFLNDAAELRYSEELVKATVAALLQDGRLAKSEALLQRVSDLVASRGFGTYVLSLSELGDSLPQWRGYSGAAGGVALGLDLQHLAPFQPAPVVAVQIEYRREVHEAAIEAILRSGCEIYENLAEGIGEEEHHHLLAMSTRELQARLWIKTLEFKGADWKSEAEWRLVLTTANPDFPHTKFRTGPLGLTPYVEVPLRHIAGPFMRKLPLREVMLGPNPNIDLNREAVAQFMRHRGYAAAYIQLETSLLPLRW